MAIKGDRHQGTNGRNRIIVEETRRNLFLHNRRMCFTYIHFVENFADRAKLYVWSDIEWCASCAYELIKKTCDDNNNFILVVEQRYTNLPLNFHNYVVHKFYLMYV